MNCIDSSNPESEVDDPTENHKVEKVFDNYINLFDKTTTEDEREDTGDINKTDKYRENSERNG